MGRGTGITWRRWLPSYPPLLALGLGLGILQVAHHSIITVTAEPSGTPVDLPVALIRSCSPSPAQTDDTDLGLPRSCRSKRGQPKAYREGFLVHCRRSQARVPTSRTIDQDKGSLFPVRVPLICLARACIHSVAGAACVHAGKPSCLDPCPEESAACLNNMLCPRLKLSTRSERFLMSDSEV